MLLTRDMDTSRYVVAKVTDTHVTVVHPRGAQHTIRLITQRDMDLSRQYGFEGTIGGRFKIYRSGHAGTRDVRYAAVAV